MSYKKQALALAAAALDPEALVDGAIIRAHFGGRSKMWLHRLRHHPDPARRFPEPDVWLGPIPHWKRGTMTGYVEAQAKRPKPLSCNPPSHNNGTKPAKIEPAALSPADGDALGQPSQPFGGWTVAAKIVEPDADSIGTAIARGEQHDLDEVDRVDRRNRAGESEHVFKMRDVSRHKSMDVLQAYVRDADMFRDHAGAGLL
jgi:hypothetical protein